MNSAVEHLKEADPDMQVLGAAYIQHQCYNDNESKHEVVLSSLSGLCPELYELVLMSKP